MTYKLFPEQFFLKAMAAQIQGRLKK